MTRPDPFARPIGRRQLLRGMGALAGGLAIAPYGLAGCGDGATAGSGSSIAAVPIGVDPGVPWWMQNNFQPVGAEVEVFDLPVTGALPTELTGLYLRNGSNPQSGTTGHWFLGDGMLHGLRLDGGRASWYRNRYVRTPLYEQNIDFTESGAPFGGNNQSNVSVIHHAGRLLTSGEVGAAYEIDPSDLGTVGVQDFDGKLNTSFTAHAKIDPTTGYLHFFGYWFGPPYLTYHVADTTGQIVHSAEIDLPTSSMMHSFAITDRDAIFYDLPVVFAPGAAVDGGFPFAWDAHKSARLGVLPLGGTADQIRWVEIEPCYVFHELNAYRDGDQIVIDVCRFDEMMNGERFGDVHEALHRWRIDTGGASLGFRDEVLFDRPMDFPVHDRRVTGRRNRHGWLTTIRHHPDTLVLGGVMHIDYQTGDQRLWDPGPNRHVGEAFFAPGGSGEGEGWLLAYTYDHARDASTFIVLDAQDVERGPVAEVALPQRVPFGFHGWWVPD